MYVYVKSEPGLWTVGFYEPNGRWEPESDHGSSDDAFARVAQLNGGGETAALRIGMDAAYRNSERSRLEAEALRAALEDLVTRCDGDEGVRADGSNICTIGAHAALGHFKANEEEAA